MKKILTTILCMMTLAGCSLPGLGFSKGDNSIIIASGSMTERQINAEIISQMIAHYMPEVEVSILTNLGSSLLMMQTIERKESHISSVMYTGTSLTGELGYEATTDVEKALELVVKGYEEKFDLVWFPTYGFDNTYAFMISKTFSETHNVHKISDLKRMASDLRAGIDTGWLDRDGDGYEAFKDLYQFEFGTILPMEIGLVYTAVQTGEMDLVLGYSSDGRIDAYDLVVLEDDLQLFPPYDASLVASKEILRAHPKLESVLLKLNGQISVGDMQYMNNRSDEERVEPRIVAKEFLEANDYFEEFNPIPLDERPLYKDMEGLK